MALTLAFNVPRLENSGLQADVHILAIRTCALTIKQARAWRPDYFLIADRPFSRIMVNDDRTLASLMADPRIKDDIRLIMSSFDRAPMIVESGLDFEILHNGNRFLPGEFAYQRDGMLLTVPFSEEWRLPTLSLTLRRIDDALHIVDTSVDIDNIFDVDACGRHKERILNAGGHHLSGGAEELWRRRKELYPCVNFLNRVEADLAGLQLSMDAFGQVSSRLRGLNASAQEWRDGLVDYPRWIGHVTDESETRRRLCGFTDDAGFSRNYSMHARYTPGCGRIHFRVVDSEKAIEVAYVGEKIGS